MLVGSDADGDGAVGVVGSCTTYSAQQSAARGPWGRVDAIGGMARLGKATRCARPAVTGNMAGIENAALGHESGATWR